MGVTYSSPFARVSVLLLVPGCFGHYNYVVYFEVKCCYAGVYSLAVGVLSVQKKKKTIEGLLCFMPNIEFFKICIFLWNNLVFP